MSTRETLQIQNLGPIRQAQIEVRDITLLLGPQATGKSLTAQTLYFMRGMEELLVPETWGGGRIPGKGYIDRQELAGKVSGLLANWLGIGGISYSDTFVSWSLQTKQGNREDRLELSSKPGSQGEQARFNQSLASRVESGVDSGNDTERFDTASIGEDQVYIPAGRMLYSFVPPSLGMFPLVTWMKQDLLWQDTSMSFIASWAVRCAVSLIALDRAVKIFSVDAAILEQTGQDYERQAGILRSRPDTRVPIENQFAQA